MFLYNLEKKYHLQMITEDYSSEELDVPNLAGPYEVV